MPCKFEACLSDDERALFILRKMFSFYVREFVDDPADMSVAENVNDFVYVARRIGVEGWLGLGKSEEDQLRELLEEEAKAMRKKVSPASPHSASSPTPDDAFVDSESAPAPSDDYSSYYEPPEPPAPAPAPAPKPAPASAPLEWSRCSGETIVGPCWGDVQLVDSIDGNAVYACEGHACRYDLGSARKDYTPPPKDYTPPFYDEFHDATVVPWPKPGPDDFRLDEAGVELAAREICRQKGLNPDERIDYPASNCDMLNIGPRWRSIVDRFKDFEAFTLALEEARRKRGF